MNKEKVFQEIKNLNSEEFNWEASAVRFFIGRTSTHFPQDVYIESRKQRDESIKWIVYISSNCLGKDGHLYYEPMPSSRTDEFIEMTRFDSKEEALEKIILYEKCDNNSQEIKDL